MRFAACLFAVACLGCGSSAPVDTKAMEGTYAVKIAKGMKSDDDTMNVTLGSGSSVLLNFVYIGFSQIRANAVSSSTIAIPRQVVKVGHSTGVMEGPASGMGTIGGDGSVSIMLDVAVPGTSGADGGGATSFAITGTKRN